MSIIQGNAKQGSTRGFYNFPLEQSLRFNDDDSAYLSWTPDSGSLSTKFTISCWVKRGTLGINTKIFGAGTDATVGTGTRFDFGYGTNDQLNFNADNTSGFGLELPEAHRDPSAWYHIVFIYNSTEAVDTDRADVYINGREVTGDLGNYPTLNRGLDVGNSVIHNIGRRSLDGTQYFDGYISDFSLIVGQALTADDFGELKNGVWIPKDPSGLTYGTNGFRLSFADDAEVEAFNTTLHRGNGGTQSITGTGFQPDLVWIKNRDNADNHYLFDSVRGALNGLNSDTTSAEVNSSNDLSSFDSDGFTVGSDGGMNRSGQAYVAWQWKAGDSNVSNTDGSITSTVRANDTYGFSIVSWTGNGSTNQSVGHGLSSAPSLMFHKKRDASASWYVTGSLLGTDGYMFLDTTEAQLSASGYFPSPTSSVFYVSGTNSGSLNNSNNYISYCWAEKAGYSKFGSYTGGTNPQTITTTFKPAFILIKAASGSSSPNTQNWYVFDNTRDVSGDNLAKLYPNLSNAESTAADNQVEFLDTGFKLKSTNDGTNASGNTYIYAAFADTREAAFWLDQSGNDNDWQPVNLDHNDTVADSPTDNFCTLNSALSDTHFNTSELSNGNLVYNEGEGNNGDGRPTGTFSVTSGKWYWEVQVPSQQNSRAIGFTRSDNIGKGNVTLHGNGFTAANSVVGIDLSDDTIDQVDKSGSHTQHASGLTGMADNDIFGISVDLDGGTFQMYRNGSTYGSSYSLSDLSDWQTYGMTPTASGNSFQAYRFNFGQLGFTYTPPTDYLALSTANLPEPTISPADDASPEDYFGAYLYTGTSGNTATIPVDFNPDMVWLKDRGTSAHHFVQDVVRGFGGSKSLSTSATDAEGGKGTPTEIPLQDITYLGGNLTFDSGDFATDGNSYVAWNWKANGSGVSNTDGSITSTVSANTESGFSICTFTGTGSNETVGHGLGSPPDWIVFMRRDGSGSDHKVYHSALGATKNLRFNNTDAVRTQSDFYNNTEPTSTVFTVGGARFLDDSTYVAYCFHSVEGFSKFGSYTGNGSSDGPFVYTGFRPAFVIFKRADASSNWTLLDSSRSPSNVCKESLYPNLSFQEENSVTWLDIVSNGFKIRESGTGPNASGSPYIYMAFAENPFKYANAR